MVYQEYCHGTFFEQVGHLLSRDRFFELVEEYRDEKRRIKILKFKRSFCLKNVRYPKEGFDSSHRCQCCLSRCICLGEVPENFQFSQPPQDLNFRLKVQL